MKYYVIIPAHNEEAFIAHNTMVTKEWRNANYEKFIETCRKYNNTPNGKVRNIIARGISGNKISKDCDKNNLMEIFMEMVKGPCFYCGVINEKLNCSKYC